ncbi:MAG: HPF/RaiA family ribosome-associated protein [Myxococcota bacterium]
MEIPLVQVSYRDLTPTEAMDGAIGDRVDHLLRLDPRIERCHVVVEAPHQSPAQHPKSYRVRFEITVPGHTVVVSKNPADHPEHRDFYVALRDAYDAARRQLLSSRDRRRGDVKVHEVPIHGQVSRLVLPEGYGFVRLSDGREVYFHEHAVTGGGWASIAAGDDVRVVLSDGDAGPQASAVVLLGKHHLPPIEHT